MGFQLDNSSFMQGAQLKQRQQENFFDAITRGIQMAQREDLMDLKKQRILADQAEKANDPTMLLRSIALKQAKGEQLTPDEKAFVVAESNMQGQKMGFDPVTQTPYTMPTLEERIFGRSAGVPTQVPQQQSQGFDFNQFAPEGMGNNPKARQVAIEETIKQKIKDTSDAKKTAKEEEVKMEAKQAFDDTLEEVLADLDALHAQGGTISEDNSILTNVGARLATTPIVGQAVQSALDPETQTLRDKMEGRRPVLFNQIKKASGLTGGELNSQYEVENQLKQLGNDNMTYEARKDLLKGLSTTFGTGRLSDKKEPKADNTPPKSSLDGLSKEQRYQLYLQMKGNQ